jgi:hypothetical protein
MAADFSRLEIGKHHKCVALLALSGTCRHHTRNEAGIRADTVHAWRRGSRTSCAVRLGLPTTPVEIIDVSEDQIRLTPELCMEMPWQRLPLQGRDRNLVSRAAAESTKAVTSQRS